MLVTGAVLVGLAVIGSLPPVRRWLGWLLLRSTGTVVRTERPDLPGEEQ